MQRIYLGPGTWDQYFDYTLLRQELGVLLRPETEGWARLAPRWAVSTAHRDWQAGQRRVTRVTLALALVPYEGSMHTR